MNDRQKVAGVAGAGVLLAGMLIFGGRPVPSPRPSPPVWRPVGSWAGSGIRSLRFSTAGAWRLSCRASGAPALLTLHSPHHATESVFVPAGREKVPAFTDRAGAHVLQVDTGGGSFAVSVEELQE